MLEKQRTVEKIHLKAPQLTKQNFIGVISKGQPYRKGGLRLEHEEIKGKHIFHNYGHGSSGIALAYGSTFMSVRSIFTYLNVDKPYDCAVVGSGLIAMLTAIQLARNGHFPIVYGSRFAKYGEKEIGKKLASQVDEGIWLPFGYDLTDKLKHELLSKISYDYYKDCLKTSRYQSFKIVTAFLRDTSVKQLKQRIPGFLYNGYKTVEIDYGNGASQPYTKFKTIKIDTQLFMEQLRVEAALRGIKFVQKNFDSQQDILSLKEEMIFNCTGYTSKKLFHDDHMTSTTDHLLIFKNPQNLDYTVDAQIRKDLHMRAHCFGDKIVLRSQTPVEVPSQQFAKKLVQQAKVFFQHKKTVPKL